MEHILRGKEVASAIMERNRPIIADLKEKGITPTLAIFRVGEKEADLSYERGAVKRFEQCGIQTVRYTFDENVSVEDFYQKLDEANKDPKIHGILVFRPLPKDRFDDTTLRNFISPEKDVDGCSDLSLAGIFTGRDLGFPPCTAQAVLEILDHYQIDVEGQNVVVLGRSGDWPSCIASVDAKECDRHHLSHQNQGSCGHCIQSRYPGLHDRTAGDGQQDLHSS